MQNCRILIAWQRQDDLFDTNHDNAPITKIVFTFANNPLSDPNHWIKLNLKV